MLQKVLKTTFLMEYWFSLCFKPFPTFFFWNLTFLTPLTSIWPLRHILDVELHWKSTQHDIIIALNLYRNNQTRNHPKFKTYCFEFLTAILKLSILRVTAKFFACQTVQTKIYAKFPIRMNMSVYSTENVPLVKFSITFWDLAFRLLW